MHHLNRAWLPSALQLHVSVKRSNWREEFVLDLKGNGEGVGYLKIANVSLSKTVLLISCYPLLALSITPSLLMKTALIRGNCLALSANCCIVILHRYILPALLRQIWRIISLASLPTRSPLFFMNLIQILSKVFIYLRKLQLQQQNSIVSAVLHIRLYLRFMRPLVSK